MLEFGRIDQHEKVLGRMEDVSEGFRDTIKGEFVEIQGFLHYVYQFKSKDYPRYWFAVPVHQTFQLEEIDQKEDTNKAAQKELLKNSRFADGLSIEEIEKTSSNLPTMDEYFSNRSLYSDKQNKPSLKTKGKKGATKRSESNSEMPYDDSLRLAILKSVSFD